MTMLKHIVACCALMVASGAVASSQSPDGKQMASAVGNSVAADAQAVAPVAGGKTQAVAEKKICRQLPSSYSRMTERVCLTAKQWEQVERNQQ
jgi:hypothetical protein